MYECRFCGYTTDSLDEMEPDETTHKGFWCPLCDGYTFLPGKEDPYSFLLLLERNVQSECNASVPVIKKNCSPLRYPGGKSRIIGRIYQECNIAHLKHFAEPFAGGASVGLSFLLSGLVEDLYLNDLDKGVYSLYKIIKTSPWALYELTEAFVPTRESYMHAKSVIEQDYTGCSELEAAWNLLVANRLAYSGIVKANCMGNPAARWNAKMLIRRMEEIHKQGDKLHVFNLEALEFIEEMYWMPDCTLFIDPPYYVKGKDLYHCYYTKEQHEALALQLELLHKGCPGADLIITYDDTPPIHSLYELADRKYLPRRYSIANKERTKNA